MKRTFDETEDEVEASLQIIRNGQQTAFWRLMCDVLDTNIERLREIIINKFEGATEKDLDKLRFKLLVYQELRDTPENLIKKLTGKVGDELELDPYEEPKKKKT